MRDLKLYYTEQEGFDINIVHGYPEYVDYENQSQDQRAAIGSVFEKGTLPGNLDVGVDWSALYQKESSLLDLYNDVQENINRVAGGDGSPGNMYIGYLVPNADGSVAATVVKGGA